MTLRLNRDQLLATIQSMKAAGNDTTELERELEALEPEVERVPRRNSRFREEEETMEERLTRRVGDLFPDGIPYKEIMDYDRRFTLKELREQCRRAGLSVSGDKHELAAKLIAYDRDSKEEDTGRMLIRKYLPTSRERGQRDENNNTLSNFHGPVELWETYSGPYQVRLYIGTNEAQYLISGLKDWKEAYELFNNASKLISNLPEADPLNRFLLPHSPTPPPEPELRFL